MDIALFCNPGNAYGGMSELDAAWAYTEMAIRGFDTLLSFSPAYEPFKEKPDLVMKVMENGKVMEKGGRKVNLTLFANQPLVRIVRVKHPLVSSSYLFNPETGLEGMLLPDLDVIIISSLSESHASEAGLEIMKFYESHGWLVGMCTSFIRKISASLNPERFGKQATILDPAALIERARQLTDYDKEKLCFGP